MQVGASLCDFGHHAANTLANALLFHGLQPTDEGANRLKLAAVDLFLRGGERDTMVTTLLGLGEPQHAIDQIDPQECAGSLPVVRSINTGTPQVRDAYRTYLDQLRDMHSAFDKARARHQADLTRQEQHRLESQQDSDNSRMLTLSTQHRIDLFGGMIDDVWKLDYTSYKATSDAQ
jgi:hypothetical protein